MHELMSHRQFIAIHCSGRTGKSYFGVNVEFRYCILYNGVGGIDNSIIQQYIGPLLDPHTGIMKPNCNGISHAADPLTLDAAVSMIWIALIVFRFRGALCDGEV